VNKKEHCLGLAYASAAILRVKALSGILFENAFDFDRFKRVDSRDRDLDYSYRTRELFLLLYKPFCITATSK
jgi:hypothetical protein